jgi:hypothetical protein
MGGKTKPGTASAILSRGYSKFAPRVPHRSNSPRSSPSPHRRPLTNNEFAGLEEVRVRNNWIRIEQAIAAKMWAALIEKKRLANDKARNNRLTAAAAVNLNNAKNLNKVFKNNKTILGRLKRLLK